MARILSAEGEQGFAANPSGDVGATVFEKALYRLALIADTNVVGKRIRKQASHCGGVPPTKLLQPFKDTPGVADPGNALYASVVQKLLDHVDLSSASALQLERIERVRWLNVEHKADLVEAALGAANAAYCLERGVPFAWSSMAGGAHGSGDEVTKWLVKAVHWESKRQR